MATASAVACPPSSDPQPAATVSGDRRFWAAVSLAAAAVATHATWMLAAPGGERSAHAFDDITEVVAAAAAAAACLAARRRRTGGNRRAWTLVAIYAAFWAAGGMVWAWDDLVLSTVPPSPSFYDIGYLGGFPFAVAGLLLLTRAPTDWRSRVRVTLDGLVIGGSLVYIAYAVLIEPEVSSFTGGPLGLGALLAFPFEDVVFASVVVLAVLWVPPGRRLVIGLLTAGFLALVGADAVYAFLSTRGAYSTGTLPDVGYVAGFLLIALGAYRASLVEQLPATPPRALSPMGLLAPSVPFVVALSVAAQQALSRGSLQAVDFFISGSIVILVLVRQVVALFDNRALARSLEQRVAHRTSELSASREALREREREFRLLFSGNPQPMWVVDEETERFLEVNDEAVAHYGYSREEFLSMTAWDLVPPEESPRLVEAIEAVRSSGRVQGIHGHRLKDGRVIDAEVVARRQRFAGRNAVLVLAQDVTEQRRMQEAFAHQALHDALTELPNRTLFLDHLSLAVARQARHGRVAAVLFLDLDNFKVVNDTLGHAAGDRVLVAVADRLRATLREGDTAARLGGDEFAVLCEDLAGADEATAIARRVLCEVEVPVLIDDALMDVGVSIGIAMARGDGRTAGALLRDADVALYRAKELGKSRYEVFDDALRFEVVDRLVTKRALAHAVERDQLRLHYQPEVSLTDGRLLGAEALVRWDHPACGLVGPAEFIPLAEESGLITGIGAWVLRSACRDAARWNERRADRFIVSVNISARQLAQPDFADLVATVLEEEAVNPGNVCLEITESVLMDDAEGAIEAMARLHALGVRLAVDDFGTGYSSLSYLQRFPLDVLKVDRAFVTDIGRSPEQQAIVRTVVALAHALGIEAVAEGVEDDEQLLRLIQLGCDAVQGFLLAKPMPAAALDILIAGGSVIDPRVARSLQRLEPSR